MIFDIILFSVVCSKPLFRSALIHSQIDVLRLDA